MRRNPLYIFQDQTSIGIYDVPLGSTVQVINSDGHGTPMFLQLVAKVGLGSYSTIANLYQYPDDYVDLSKIGEVYSELEKITEDSGFGATTGWRMLGRDPIFYGNIGKGAIDFSLNDLNDSDRDKRGATGWNAFATGYNTRASGENSFTTGQEVIAGGLNQFSVGQYNKNDLGNILEVGIGTGVGADTDTRKNAFQIDRNGVILAPSMDVTAINNSTDRVLVTKEYFVNNSSSGELIKLDEGNGNGWVLKGRSPDFYDGIGHRAIDFSYSTMINNENGASGDSSFATGYNVIMRNDYGAVFGFMNDPHSDTLFEIGNGSGVAPSPRANALEVYTDGRIVAPSLAKTNIIDERSLITKEYLGSVGVASTLTDIDIVNNNLAWYSYELNGNYDAIPNVDVFNNGVLLREGSAYDYMIDLNIGKISLRFSTNYTIHVGDWIRTKAASLAF